MTRFVNFFGLKAITLSAALSMTAGLALAGDNNVSTGQILDALKPKPATRGLSAGPQADPAVQAKESTFLNTVRNRSTRSLSTGERDQIAELAATKPNIDLEIQFDYNSANIAKTSVSSVQALGKALSDPSLKGSTFVVAGHTRCGRRRRIQSGPLRTSRRHHQEVPGAELRPHRHRSRHRRLRQDQAEGYRQRGRPHQPPRPGREHGYQDRVEVIPGHRQ
ncbi:hypothetical protein ACVWZZ_006385 [Bradyrhizobium sp. LM6.10]